MYAGYVKFGDTVIIDNHMTQSYANVLGIPWLKGCTNCAGLEPRDRKFVTPLKDTVKPPWWGSGSRDAMSFLGLYGLSLAGADNSTREVDAIEGIADGGHTGARRFKMRTLTIKAVAVAESDCALGYGLEWLHSLDTDGACNEYSVGLYECCPCVCGPGCEDPTCQQSCVVGYQRQFRRCRVLSGPTVLARRTMPGGGAMAEVELQIIAQDPHYYRPVAPFHFDAVTGTPLTDAAPPPPPPAPGGVVGDPFDLTPPEPVSLWMDVLPVREPRHDWVRVEHDALLPVGFRDPLVAPEIVVSAAHGSVEEVRIGLWTGGVEVAEFIAPFVPDGGSVRVDYGSRRVFTEYGGVERINLAFVTGHNGGPIVWPAALPAADYRITVDRPPSAPPVTVEVAMSGTGAP
jgi:hypothetical protein